MGSIWNRNIPYIQEDKHKCCTSEQFSILLKVLEDLNLIKLKYFIVWMRDCGEWWLFCKCACSYVYFLYIFRLFVCSCFCVFVCFVFWFVFDCLTFKKYHILLFLLFFYPYCPLLTIVLIVRHKFRNHTYVSSIYNPS